MGIAKTDNQGRKRGSQIWWTILGAVLVVLIGFFIIFLKKSSTATFYMDATSPTKPEIFTVFKKIHNRYGCRVWSNGNEIFVADVQGSSYMLAPKFSGFVPDSIIWYWNPAFGIDNNDAFTLDVYGHRTSGSISVDFGTTKVNCGPAEFWVNGLFYGDYPDSDVASLPASQPTSSSSAIEVSPAQFQQTDPADIDFAFQTLDGNNQTREFIIQKNPLNQIVMQFMTGRPFD